MNLVNQKQMSLLQNVEDKIKIRNERKLKTECTPSERKNITTYYLRAIIKQLTKVSAKQMDF